MAEPKSLSDDLTRAEPEFIWHTTRGRICPYHDIQVAPRFDANGAIVGWKCWACEAGHPPLTDREREALEEEVEVDEQEESDDDSVYSYQRP